MRRCGCAACLLKAALELLRTDRMRMAATLVEQVLQQVEQRTTTQAKPPARARRARARP